MRKSSFNAENYSSNYGIWVYLDRARFAIYRLRELELAAYNITVEQYLILTILINEGGSATTKRIEELTLRQHHSISTLINRMIKINCVDKQKSSRGKGFEITITPEGRKLQKKVPVVSINNVFSALSPEEKNQLTNLLNVVFTRSRNLLVQPYIPHFTQPVTIGEKGSSNVKPKTGENLSDYEMWTNLYRTSFAVYRLRELELAQFGITPEQMALLILLVHEGGSAITKKIEGFTLRQHHSVSTLVDRMLKTGYVDKQKNPNGRGFEFTITREGRDLIKKVPSVSFDMAFSDLSMEERKQMAHILLLVLLKVRESLGRLSPFSEYDYQR
jgi:DNA-binding MarR family transcriptional regulator